MREISILIADNSAWTRAMVRRVLETRFGTNSIYEAEDGRRAIAFLEALKIDLVITAVELAHTSGLELLAFIKDHEKLNRLPVLVISSHADDRTRVAAIEHGAVRYLTKPFTPDDLETAVRISWTDASRRREKRYAGLPAHSLTLQVEGEKIEGRIMDLSSSGIAGRFPYYSTYEVYAAYQLFLAFDPTEKYPGFNIGPLEGVLLRIEGTMGDIGDEPPHCVLAFHLGEKGVDGRSRNQLELLLARIAAEMPEIIADKEAEQ